MKSVSDNSRFSSLVMASLLITFNACNFAQSVEKDLQTGLTTRGKGLSCNNVYLSDGEQIIKRNTFAYGESYYMNFDGMEGFEREGNNAFPDMQMVIVSEGGDTTLHHNDLYAEYVDGIENSPLELYAEVTVADPMHSGEKYTLYVNIADKRGNGTYRATLDFKVARDEKIRVNGEQVTFGEIYLFSQQGGHTITNGEAEFNENIYLLFEGLDGFFVEDGQVQLGLSLVVKDADGKMILDETDLFGDSGLNYSDVHSQVAPNFILSGSEAANPVSCTVRIWDKRSSAWISASTDIEIN